MLQVKLYAQKNPPSKIAFMALIDKEGWCVDKYHAPVKK